MLLEVKWNDAHFDDDIPVIISACVVEKSDDSIVEFDAHELLTETSMVYPQSKVYSRIFEIHFDPANLTLLRLDEHGGGQSYHHDVRLWICEDQEVAIELTENMLDSEHHSETDYPCEDCSCNDKKEEEECPCLATMKKELEKSGGMSLSGGYEEGYSAKIYKVALPYMSPSYHLK
jgi:hypothetical protein